MLSKFVKMLGGDPNKREVERLSGQVEAINVLESRLESLSDEALRAKTDEFRARLKDELDGIDDDKERREVEQAVLNDLLPEAFAIVREASKRTLGLRHYDVQLMGGMALHYGRISEMRTGEGKTLVATLPLYLNALTGRGAHLVTVNDYLARRDARWMAPIFNFLGLSVGVLQMAAVTENGKKAFLVDLEKESPQEDKDKLRMVDRREAYAADITYGTNAEFGFDYLRDNMVYRYEDKVQRGHYYSIVDEVDNVLVDEARTPLIISGPAQGDLGDYATMAQVVRQLKEEDYEVSEKDRNVSLTEVGTAHVEQLLGQPLRDPDRPEDVTPEQARLLGYLEQALRAQFLFKRNKDYIVQGGKVIIVDDFTGRLMPGRRWSDGLHQAVEAKEGVKVEPENVTYATITLQNYFRMYEKLAGMTGTALTEAEEFAKIYKLEVLPIPTHLEYLATREGSDLVEVKKKDEDGYEQVYFARKDDADKAPVLWRRTDYPDVVFRTVEAKFRAIIAEIIRSHVMGRPVLLGTTSVENSEKLSSRLRAESVRRLLQIRLLRDFWFEANNLEEDGRLHKDLEPLYQPLEGIDPSALRQFAKPLNASINLEEPQNISRLLSLLRLSAEDEPRLKAVIQGGVPHQVLNARKHTEESQIIAGAGAFGAVTIATNMAGRGVDIKLGGELAEEVFAVVNRVLRKAGHQDPYDMTPQQQREALLKLDTSEFGIYESEIRYFLNYFDDMAHVRELGGLHVIGSERHEARRIDNQLRGRAARQGDPGSSRFYLSLEDDLMRLFGGQQVNDVMQRFRLDDDFPLEHRMVTGMIEGSQHRVEGNNFDMRKHLLEYDDVLNSQRRRIYEQRDRVFKKEDLTDDVAELLKAEVAARVPAAMEDEEGPWKLLAWLDSIQPPFAGAQGKFFPSFSYRLLLDELAESTLPPREAIVNLVRRAIEAEESHLLASIESNIDKAAESLESQLEERFDVIDTFLEGLQDAEETRRPQELLEELNGLARVSLRLNNEQLRTLQNDPQEIEDVIKEQIETQLTGITVSRLASFIELRLSEPLSTNRETLAKMEWAEVEAELRTSAVKMLETRRERLGGAGGEIIRTLDTLQGKIDFKTLDESGFIQLLGSLVRGRRMVFDIKTRQRSQQDYARFSYVYLAAQLMEGRSTEATLQDINEHLDEARQAFAAMWESFEGGRVVLNQTYRRLLLGVISELWVDYLTRVEALRVSIGLEAYGQRDPLVQYKTKASEMFQTLLSEIRSGVVGRMFLFQPQRATMANASQPVIETPSAEETTESAEAAAKSGRKRHKRR